MCCVVAAGPRACRDVSTMLYFHIYRIRVFFLLPFAYLHSNVSWGKANQLCVCSRYAANWGWYGEQLKAKARLLRWAAVHSACLNTGRNGLVSWAEKWLCSKWFCTYHPTAPWTPRGKTHPLTCKRGETRKSMTTHSIMSHDTKEMLLFIAPGEKTKNKKHTILSQYTACGSLLIFTLVT